MTDLPASAVPYPALRLDDAGRVVELNALAEAVFAVDPLGKPFGSLFDEASALPSTPDALRDWLGEGRPLAVHDAHGQARYQARAQVWGGGALVVLVSLTVQGPREVDVDLLAKAVDAANISVVLADLRRPDDPLVYANEWFLEFTGYTAEEVVGRNCRFLQVRNGERDDAGDGQGTALDAIRRGIAEAEHVGGVVLRNYRKDGTLFYNELYLTPISDETGGVTHMIGVQNDVTARVEAQREREREAERLRDIFAASAAPLGLLERQPDGTLAHVLMNEVAADALRLTDADLRAGAAATHWISAAATAARSGEPTRLDVTRDGRTFEVLLSPVEGGAEGAPDRFLYVAADVTAGREATEDLLHVSNRQLRQIAQNVHDGVGQSLAGAAMLASALAADLAKSDHAREAERLRDLLISAQAQLRSFALGLDPVDLDRIGMGEALGRLAAEAEAALGVSVAVRDLVREAGLRDELMLDVYRIAQEALTNAVRHGRADEVQLVLRHDGDGDLVLIIDDDGAGISEAAAHNGGMGLRTMRARAQRHGGSLEVGPGDDGGTRVHLRLPPERLT
ncbi:PAS domain-containing protein [Rubrivirga marina]|uniref:Oxygen sensor histidine kinase NreB n=1 Tax=Rubrivirga marina TaxID=1196024 RepID=A0A271J5C9_9BACT|nr:PAS domain-containing protein [Rubrivirga marina]PAP78467.1 hypothetical protein BSZ37_19565 [Rubrivirga marina]